MSSLSSIGVTDHLAGGVPQHDRLLDPHGVAERGDVVGPALEAVDTVRGLVAAARAPQVEADDLGHVGQLVEPRLEDGVIGVARRAVQQPQRWSLDRLRPAGVDTDTVDIEVEPRPVDLDPHASAPDRSTTGIPAWITCVNARS